MFDLFSVQGDLGPVGPQGPTGIPGIGSQGEQVIDALALSLQYRITTPILLFNKDQSRKHQ